MEVTLEITNYCEYGCTYCPAQAGDKDTEDNPIFYLATSYVKEFLESIKAKYNIDRINISGGEPLANNEFYDILKLCKSYTENVWVYTNVLDRIVYNANVVGEVVIQADVYLVPGEQPYVPKNANKVNLVPVDKSITDFIKEDSYDHLCLKADGYVVKIK